MTQTFGESVSEIYLEVCLDGCIVDSAYFSVGVQPKFARVAISRTTFESIQSNKWILFDCYGKYSSNLLESGSPVVANFL